MSTINEKLETFWSPYPYTTGTGTSTSPVFSGTTITYSPSNITIKTTEGYAYFVLPRSEMPEKVYIDGMLKTCGILNSNAQYAYDGKNKLIFRESEISGGWMYEKKQMSIEYSDEIYHYDVQESDDGVKVKCKLLSIVRKK